MFAGMKRKLGNSGVELGPLTIGTWGLCAESYGPVAPEDRVATLTRAIELGITSFDMAPTWGSDGLSERSVARAVGSRRSEMVYITRAGYVPTEDGPVPAFAPDEVRAQVERSLTNLATDVIDVLLLSHPTFSSFLDESLPQLLDALVTEGKVRTWGVSVSHVDDARSALELGAKVLCLPFNMVQPDIVWDLTSDCRERGVGLLARSVLAHGLLSGRWSEKRHFTPDDHRMFRWSADALGARVRQAGEYKRRIAPAAPSMATVALQFALAHELVASAIFGPRTPLQVASALEAVATPSSLTVADLQFHYNHLR